MRPDLVRILTLLRSAAVSPRPAAEITPTVMPEVFSRAVASCTRCGWRSERTAALRNRVLFGSSVKMRTVMWSWQFPKAPSTKWRSDGRLKSGVSLDGGDWYFILESMPGLVFLDVFLFQPQLFRGMKDEHFHAYIRGDFHSC